MFELLLAVLAVLGCRIGLERARRSVKVLFWINEFGKMLTTR